MSYQSMHPTTTATVKRATVTEIPGSGGKQRRSVATVGSVAGGYEDLGANQVVVHGPDGKVVQLAGRLYCDRAQDLPVKRADLVVFTDPATAETLTLEVIGRRGPFDVTDPEDHFELDLAPEQVSRSAA